MQTNNLKEKYFNKLKEVLIFVDKSHKFNELCDAYKKISNEIKKSIKDASLYIDVGTQNLIVSEQLEKVIPSSLKKQYQMLCKLDEKKKEYGWDEISNAIDTILTIGSVKDIEKEIYAEYGKERGEQLIIKTKKEVLELEEILGLTFYSVDIINFNQKNRFSRFVSNENIILTANDNIDIQHINLINDDGEMFKAKKYAQVNYQKQTYILFEFKMDSENEDDWQYLVYRLVEQNGKQLFIEETDDDIIDEVMLIEEKIQCGQN